MQFNLTLSRSNSSQGSLKHFSAMDIINHVVPFPDDHPKPEEASGSCPFLNLFAPLSRTISDSPPKVYEVVITAEAQPETVIESSEKPLEINEGQEESKFKSFLKKFFNGEEIVGCEKELDQKSLTILTALIQRKFGKKLKNLRSSDNFFGQLHAILATDSKKRPEENTKFIFKHVLKAMRENYKKKLGVKRCRKHDFETAFYQSYFKEVAEKRSIPIETFFHPRNVVGPALVGHKTINLEYLKDIYSNPKFVSDFLEELEFLNKRWPTKMQAKLAILEKKINDALASNDPDAVQNISRYITNNSKCKLPWTTREVKNASLSVCKMFQACQEVHRSL